MLNEAKYANAGATAANAETGGAGGERSAGGFNGATTRIRIYLDVFRRRCGTSIELTADRRRSSIRRRDKATGIAFRPLRLKVPPPVHSGKFGEFRQDTPHLGIHPAAQGFKWQDSQDADRSKISAGEIFNERGDIIRRYYSRRDSRRADLFAVEIYVAPLHLTRFSVKRSVTFEEALNPAG